MKKLLILIAASLLLQGCMFGRNVRHALIGRHYYQQQPTVVIVQQPRYRR